MGEYFEGNRVGAWVASHRALLGVRFSDLIAAAGPGSEQAIRHAERAERPSVELLERHHAALMAAYVTDGTVPAVSLARREQWYANEYDAALWMDASERNPRVSWWWGLRHHKGPRGAWCYVCEALIHGYDVGRGMTVPARQAVMAHRLMHINEMIAASAAETKESGT